MDEEKENLNEPIDKLDDMFYLCAKFQKRVFGHNLPAKISQRIPITVTSIIGELGEILEEEQSWKDWRKNPPTVNETALLFEVVDLWHFIINLTLYLGIDAKVLFNAFLEKNSENHRRQQNGY
jgi:dimeric dUTPase (all-alpha-NTP-PPase superfamily)